MVNEAARKIRWQDKFQVDPALTPGHSGRLKRQVEFLLEIDQLKQISRQTILLDRSRHENSGEHSWHIALSAMIFSEYAGANGVNLDRVLRMLLLHDLVEIDAGDTYCYDERAGVGQHERERVAAARRIQPPDGRQAHRDCFGRPCSQPAAGNLGLLAS